MFDFAESDSQRSSHKKMKKVLNRASIKSKFGNSAISNRSYQSKNAESENDGSTNPFQKTIDELQAKVLRLEEQLVDQEIEKNLEIAKLQEKEQQARDQYETIHGQMILDKEEHKLLDEIVLEANKHLEDLQEDNIGLQAEIDELQRQNTHLNSCVRDITINQSEMQSESNISQSQYQPYRASVLQRNQLQGDIKDDMSEINREFRQLGIGAQNGLDTSQVTNFIERNLLNLTRPEVIEMLTERDSVHELNETTGYGNSIFETKIDQEGFQDMQRRVSILSAQQQAPMVFGKRQLTQIASVSKSRPEQSPFDLKFNSIGKQNTNSPNQFLSPRVDTLKGGLTARKETTKVAQFGRGSAFQIADQIEDEFEFQMDESVEINRVGDPQNHFEQPKVSDVDKSMVSDNSNFVNNLENSFVIEENFFDDELDTNKSNSRKGSKFNFAANVKRGSNISEFKSQTKQGDDDPNNTSMLSADFQRQTSDMDGEQSHNPQEKDDTFMKRKNAVEDFKVRHHLNKNIKSKLLRQAEKVKKLNRYENKIQRYLKNKISNQSQDYMSQFILFQLDEKSAQKFELFLSPSQLEYDFFKMITLTVVLSQPRLIVDQLLLQNPQEMYYRAKSTKPPVQFYQFFQWISVDFARILYEVKNKKEQHQMPQKVIMKAFLDQQ